MELNVMQQLDLSKDERYAHGYKDGRRELAAEIKGILTEGSVEKIQLVAVLLTVHSLLLGELGGVKDGYAKSTT